MSWSIGQHSRQQRIAHYRPAYPRILELHRVGFSQRAIALLLNKEGFLTPTGKPINQGKVSDLLKDAKELEASGQLSAPPPAPVPVQPVKEATPDDWAMITFQREHDLGMQAIQIALEAMQSPLPMPVDPPKIVDTCPATEWRCWMTRTKPV